MNTETEFDKVQKILLFFVVCIISILSRCTDSQPTGLAAIVFTILCVALAITAIAMFSKKNFGFFGYWLELVHQQ